MLTWSGLGQPYLWLGFAFLQLVANFQLNFMSESPKIFLKNKPAWVLFVKYWISVCILQNLKTLSQTSFPDVLGWLKLHMALRRPFVRFLQPFGSWGMWTSMVFKARSFGGSSLRCESQVHPLIYFRPTFATIRKTCKELQASSFICWHALSLKSTISLSSVSVTLGQPRSETIK